VTRNAALAAGIGMVHQHFTLADQMTVLENIVLGTRPLWSFNLGKSAAREKIRHCRRITVWKSIRTG
jgi:ABC-type uncharacterized transport system ATPase subunit